MQMALDEARKAAGRDEIPVGAVLVDQEGKLLARNGNRSIELSDPAGHAELMVLREAGRNAGNYRLTGSTLYVTLEPCVMCAGAMVHARVGKLVFGATDPKAGGVMSKYQVGQDGLLNHIMEVEGGLLAAESASLLRDFFKRRRA
jgi:tRNA(adenine34) deaminase